LAAAIDTRLVLPTARIAAPPRASVIETPWKPSRLRSSPTAIGRESEAGLSENAG
jgi:hypothetical protein